MNFGVALAWVIWGLAISSSRLGLAEPKGQEVALVVTDCAGLSLERGAIIEAVTLELAQDGFGQVTTPQAVVLTAPVSIQVICSQGGTLLHLSVEGTEATTKRREMDLGDVAPELRPRAVALGLAELVRSATFAAPQETKGPAPAAFGLETPTQPVPSVVPPQPSPPPAPEAPAHRKPARPIEAPSHASAAANPPWHVSLGPGARWVLPYSLPLVGLGLAGGLRSFEVGGELLTDGRSSAERSQIRAVLGTLGWHPLEVGLGPFEISQGPRITVGGFRQSQLRNTIVSLDTSKDPSANDEEILYTPTTSEHLYLEAAWSARCLLDVGLHYFVALDSGLGAEWGLAPKYGELLHDESVHPVISLGLRGGHRW